MSKYLDVCLSSSSITWFVTKNWVLLWGDTLTIPGDNSIFVFVVQYAFSEQVFLNLQALHPVHLGKQTINTVSSGNLLTPYVIYIILSI